MTRKSRIATLVGLGLAMVLGSLVSASSAHAATVIDSTGSATVTGVVDAASTATAFNTITVGSAGPMKAVLSWSSPSADLNLFVKSPAGNPLASSTLVQPSPETVLFTAAAPGPYRFTVKARTGSSPFTLVVSSTARAQTVRRYAPVFMLGGTHKYTTTEAADLARKSDVVVGIRGDFTGRVTAMKNANPNVKILVYMNGSFVQETEANTYPSSWYAHNAAGLKVRSNNYGNYLMRHDLPSWRQNRLAFCQTVMAEDRFDGCMVDMLGTGALGDGYLNSAPINPATNAVWTLTDWIGSTSGVIGSIRSAIPGATFVGNGVGNGRRWADTTVPQYKLIDAADAQMAETWGRIPEAPINAFYPEDRWKQDFDLLADAEARGGAIAITVKTWVASSQAQRDQWHRLTLATFLLGTGGKSSYSFLESAATLPGNDPWAEINPGVPLAAASKDAGGAWVRRFSHGLALANPTTAPVTFDLGTSVYLAEDATLLTGSLTLGPNTGRSLALP